MDCEALLELISDYLDGNLDGATQSELDAHFGDCPECIEFLKEMRQSIKWAIECLDQSPDMPESVRSRLLSFADKLEKGHTHN